MRLTYCIAITLFFSTACTQKHQIGSDFGDPIPLTSILQNPSIFASYPEAFFSLDSFLVVISPRIGDDFGRLISQKTFQEVGTFGNRGKGPKETIWPYMLPHDLDKKKRSFLGYDLPSRSIITYTLQQQGDTLTMQTHDKRRVDSQNENPNEPNLKICRLDSNYYMGNCFHKQDQFFSLLDKNLNTIGYFGNSPIPEDIFNAHERLQGLLQSSYGIAIFTPLELPYIGCYTIQEGKPAKLWEDNFADMNYHVTGKTLLYNSKKTRGVTRDLQITPRYIYILWYDDLVYNYYNSDQGSSPGGRVVFVYDHQGNRITRYALDVDVTKIAVSEDERTLYGLTTPDYALVTFELPETYPQN